MQTYCIPGYHSFSFWGKWDAHILDAHIPADSGKTWGTTSQLVPETTWVPTAGLQAVFWHADALILWVIFVFWCVLHCCGTFLPVEPFTDLGILLAACWLCRTCVEICPFDPLKRFRFRLKHFRQLKAAIGCFKLSIWAKALLFIAVFARVAIRAKSNWAELAASPKLWIFGDRVDRADSNLHKWAQMT